MLQVLLSLNVYRNKGGGLGGLLRLQIMELRKRGLRSDVTAKTARERKVASCGGRLHGLAVRGCQFALMPLREAIWRRRLA